MRLLPDTKNCALRMRRVWRERFPRHQLLRKPPVSDPSMHHGTCVTHVPWCMSGSLIRSGTACNFMYLTRGPWIACFTVYCQAGGGQITYHVNTIWIRTVWCHFNGQISPRYSQKTPHSSSVRVRYWVYFFVGLDSDTYSAHVPVMRYAISCYNVPHYNGTWQYLHPLNCLRWYQLAEETPVVCVVYSRACKDQITRRVRHSTYWSQDACSVQITSSVRLVVLIML